MVNENNELIIELWARLKSHIPPKERLEVADIMIVVFDEFGKVDDDLMDEDLDRELRAAVRSHIGDPLDIEEDEDFDDN
mgnify:CR=1 FL=1|jgi:hypothetical protein